MGETRSMPREGAKRRRPHPRPQKIKPPPDERLILDNVRLAYAAVRDHRRPYVDYHEARATAVLALVEAASTYDPARSSFSGWAYRVARSKITLMNRRAAIRGEPVSLETVFHVAAPNGHASRAEERIDIGIMLKRLPALDQKVLTLYYGLGGTPPRTYRQIGMMLGLSHEWIRRIETSAVETLRQIFS